MNQELQIALLTGLGGMLGWGFADFFAKKTVDKIGSILTLFWAHVVGSLLLLGILLYQLVIIKNHINLDFNLKTWLFLFLFGASQSVVYLLVYKGFAKGQIALLSPIFSSYSGFTSILSIAIFGEIVSKHIFVGLLALFIGILLINLDFHAFKLKKNIFKKIPGFIEIISATLLAAIWTLLWNQFVEEKDWFSFALFMYLFMTLTIIIYAKYSRINLFVVPYNIWKFIILIGLFEIIAYLAISFGYGVTSLTSIIALISGTFSLPTIFLARLFLKEKISAIQTSGGIIIIIGVMILSFL